MLSYPELSRFVPCAVLSCHIQPCLVMPCCALSLFCLVLVLPCLALCLHVTIGVLVVTHNAKIQNTTIQKSKIQL
jgi:hypothetical protein